MPVFTLAEIAKKIAGELHGDPELKITGVAELEKASADTLTFLANPKYKSKLESTRAAAVLVDSKLEQTPAIPYIKTGDAYYAFLQAFLMFHPPRRLLEAGIHPSATIHETARIGKAVCIGANVYLGEQVTIGDRTQVFPNSVVLNGSQIGEDCIIYPLVTIREDCLIGKRVIVHSGAVIGSDGFGFAPHEGRYYKIPQVGRVIVEDDVEIGANTAIDRATMGETVIKAGVKLDNLIQIAHNVSVGENTVIAAQSGISGSTRLGKNVIFAGQVGVVGHITIGDRVVVGAQSGVSNSIAEEEVYFGSPARPIMKMKRIEASLNYLPELLKRVKKLEEVLETFEHGER